MNILGIDVGGSAIKGAVVNDETGDLIGEKIRIPIEPTFLPEDVVATIGQIKRELNYEGPMGVGFPSIVSNGVVMIPATARNIVEWVNFPVAQRIQALTGCPTVVINDADAAGLAEMRFGVGKGEMGVVITLTFGTGIGSGLFMDGRLVPNSEFGRLYLQGRKSPIEQQAAARIREEKGLSWEKWGDRVNAYLQHLELILSPNLIIIGGGASKKADKFLPQVHIRARVKAAELENEAGIVGAAMAG